MYNNFYNQTLQSSGFGDLFYKLWTWIKSLKINKEKAIDEEDHLSQI